MNEYKFLGEVIFLWEGWEELDEEWNTFYGVQFPFESMKQFNGACINISDEGMINISASTEDLELDENGMIKIPEPLWENYAIAIPEFRAKIYEKFPLNI